MATDQTTRLEAATVKAENGSQIVYDFANGPATATVPTASGPIPTLAGKLAEISDTLAISAGIYPTTTAGLAATNNGQVFLVYASDDDDIIYRVYQNQNGTAFDTGKNTISGTDLENALQQADAAATTAQQAATQAQGLVGDVQTVTKRVSYFVNASEFGATPGQDIGPAIQAAADAGHTIITVSAGQYKWTTQVTIQKLIFIIGAGYVEGPDPANGTWFELNKTGFTPIVFQNADIRGSAIRGCAFWESNHPASQVQGWTPANNDYVIKIVNCLGSVDLDVFMVRVNRGVYCYGSGRLNIEKIKGQFYTAGVEIDNCLDIPRINYMHAWTFYTTNKYVQAWQQANLDVLILRRVDGIFLGNIFALGCRSQIRLDKSNDGVPTKIYCDASYADFAKYGLWVPSGCDNVTAQLSQLTIQGEDSNNPGIGLVGGAAIKLEGNNASIQIALLHTQRHYQSVVSVSGSGNRLDIGEFWAEKPNQANDGSPIFSLANTTGEANQVNVTGGVRVTDSGNAPIMNGSTNGSLMVSAIANRPAGATDEPRQYWGNGYASYATVSPNANSDTRLEAKGPNGRARLMSNSKTVVSVDDGAGNGAVSELIRGGASNLSYILEGGGANLDRDFNTKGTGKNRFNSPVQFQGFAFASVPSAASYSNGTIRITDRNNRLATSDGTNWRFQDGSVIA